MPFFLSRTPLAALFFATAVHAYEPSLYFANQGNVQAANVSPFPPQPSSAPPQPPQLQQNDAALPGGAAEALEPALEEGQQRVALPKTRGKQSLALGLLVMVGLLVYLAVHAKESNAQNNVIDMLKSPTESFSTKARALTTHILHPAAIHPQSGLLLTMYVAAWALAVSGLFEYIKTRKVVNKIKTAQKDLVPLPEMPPDTRARTLGIVGLLLAGVSALGLILNVHASLFYFFDVGMAVFAAGAGLLVTKILKDSAIKDILFPEGKNAKPQDPKP